MSRPVIDCETLCRWGLRDRHAVERLCRWARTVAPIEPAEAIVGIELGEGQLTVLSVGPQTHFDGPPITRTVPVSDLPPAWPASEDYR